MAVAAEARVGLGADADDVADLDVAFGLGADADGDADDLVADDDGVGGLALGEPISIVFFAPRFAPRLGDGRGGGCTQPERSVCRSEPQMPECVTLMSTSVSSHGFGSYSFQTILPSTDDGSRPIQPSNL